MKELTTQKRTINFERKMHYKMTQNSKYIEKCVNAKRAIRFGYDSKDDIAKYGIKQCLERCEDYSDLIA